MATEAPEHSALIQRALAIPQKRFDRNMVQFLTQQETDALLAAPDTSSWIGRRDHALFLLAEQTGLCVSEITRLTRADVDIEGPGAHVRCMGKGRKERVTPLRKETVAVPRAWLREQRAQPTEPLFPSQRGGFMSRDAVEKRLHKHASKAAASCPSLAQESVSPHVLRHTRAVRMLDSAVIALWLGHESVETTHACLAADLAAKERALAKAAPSIAAARRDRPPDRLLAFLSAL